MIQFNEGFLGLFSFFDIDENYEIKNYLENISNILSILFKNERLIMYIMNHSLLWKLLLNFLGKLFSSKYIMEYKIGNLIGSILFTLPYWKIHHLIYAFNQVDLIQHLANAIINGYATHYFSRTTSIMLYVLRIVFVLDRIYMEYKNTKDYNFCNLLVYKYLDIEDDKKYKKLKQKKKSYKKLPASCRPFNKSLYN